METLDTMLACSMRLAVLANECYTDMTTNDKAFIIFLSSFCISCPSYDVCYYFK